MKLTLESDSGTGLDGGDLRLSSGVLEVVLVAAELGAGHVGDLSSTISRL